MTFARQRRKHAQQKAATYGKKKQRACRATDPEDTETPHTVLARNNLRRTRERIAVLGFLMKHIGPHTVDMLSSTVSTDVHKVTLYRMLEQFSEQGIVERVYGGDGKRWYEYQHNHHHHVTCTVCGARRSVHVREDSMNTAAQRQVRDFARITGHTLEFFGVCTTCDS